MQFDVLNVPVRTRNRISDAPRVPMSSPSLGADRAFRTTSADQVHALGVSSLTPIRVVLADSHLVVRSGVRLLLASEGIEVVAVAGDVDAALRAVNGYKPDVLLIELNLSGALAAVPLVKERSPATATVVLSTAEDAGIARDALRAGVLGYVQKSQTGAEVVRAIRLTAGGEAYLAPALGVRLAALPEQPAGPPDGLTTRELQVLVSIALGHTNAEIGAMLFLSVRTVETHRSHIQRKLDLTSRAGLVSYALRNGLLR